MAYTPLNYYPPTIGMHQNLTVILSEDQSSFNSDTTVKPLKTLMLLHGLSSDETAYIRYTSIKGYANEHRLAVITSNVDHSACVNTTYGHSCYDRILEVYDYVHQIFSLPKKRDDNFIAGHSMGECDTIKLALT